MLLVHKDISHMPITELENDSESIWVKVFANKTSHFVASWYRPPGSTSEEFQLFRELLDYIRTHHNGKKLPSVHVLGDFNFKDIDWPDRLSKSGSTLSQSEGQILIDIMNDHGLEQMIPLPTREKNTLDLILTTLPGQFKDVHSPDKLSDHDIVSGTLKIFIPHKETSEKGVSISERWLWIYEKIHRHIHGGGVMLLVHKNISHMPITELENDSESVWVKVFANKTSHFVASWYRPPGSTSEEFQLFREQLDYNRTHHKGKKLPSVHVLGDFNFKDIDWPDWLSKSGSTLSQSEGQILIDIMNDHGLEQIVHFPTREKNTLDLILTTLPGQFKDVHSPDKLSDHDIVSGTLKIPPPPNKETSEKGVSISERWLWIYEKRHTWVCKGKILQWSLGYSFSTGELWFVNFFYSTLGG